MLPSERVPVCECPCSDEVIISWCCQSYLSMPLSNHPAVVHAATAELLSNVCNTLMTPCLLMHLSNDAMTLQMESVIGLTSSVLSLLLINTRCTCVQQLQSLWDDYQTKINEQLNDHVTVYASHFPEAKVGQYVTVMSLLLK